MSGGDGRPRARSYNMRASHEQRTKYENTLYIIKEEEGTYRAGCNTC